MMFSSMHHNILNIIISGYTIIPWCIFFGRPICFSLCKPTITDIIMLSFPLDSILCFPMNSTCRKITIHIGYLAINREPLSNHICAPSIGTTLLRELSHIVILPLGHHLKPKIHQEDFPVAGRSSPNCFSLRVSLKASIKRFSSNLLYR